MDFHFLALACLAWLPSTLGAARTCLSLVTRRTADGVAVAADPSGQSRAHGRDGLQLPGGSEAMGMDAPFDPPHLIPIPAGRALLALAHHSHCAARDA